MRILCAALCVLCAGCTTTETVTETVDVRVPVAVPCLSESDLPAEVPSAAESITIDSEPGEKIKAVLIERSRLRAADKEWRGVVAGCLE